jgi:hypothetical protein
MKTIRSSLFIFTISGVLTGCSTSKPHSIRSPANATGPYQGFAPTDKEIRKRAEGYLASGVATDMGAAQRMAHDYYWPIITTTQESSSQKERRLERERLLSEASKKK